MYDKKALLSNNVWGTKNYNKRNKLFEYFKKSASPDTIVFLQETHSSEKNKIRWNDGFKG